jgi:hypothetical protein
VEYNLDPAVTFLRKTKLRQISLQVEMEMYYLRNYLSVAVETSQRRTRFGREKKSVLLYQLLFDPG